MARKIIHCSRCSRRYRGHGDWNATVKAGVIVGLLCPACQTPEENAEALVNEATLDYLGVGADGRHKARPKDAP